MASRDLLVREKEMLASRKIVFLVECCERLRLYRGKERKKVKDEGHDTYGKAVDFDP